MTKTTDAIRSAIDADLTLPTLYVDATCDRTLYALALAHDCADTDARSLKRTGGIVGEVDYLPSNLPG